MKPLTINFAWQRRNWRLIAGMAFVAVVVMAAIASGWIYFQLHAEQERWQSDWQRLNGLASAKPDSGTPEAQERIKSEMRFANHVIDKLDTPWDALFGAVEGAYSDQAALLSVEPDSERREVRLTAEAKSLTDMLAYLKQVSQSPVLRDAYLASHQINQQDAQRPVRFTIEARWIDVPAAVADTSTVTPIAAISIDKIAPVTPVAKP